MDKMPLVIAVSGASGAIYGLTAARMALENGVPLYLIVSDTARSIVSDETGRSWEDWVGTLERIGELEIPDVKDLSAAISSGSVKTLGMVIAPCSMGTLGRIASGVSSNLIERCADVCLKERRRLIMLTRETPLSAIHIRNMQAVNDAGGVIMPPVPAFYAKPATIDDIIEHTCSRVMDMLDIPAADTFRWRGYEGTGGE